MYKTANTPVPDVITIHALISVFHTKRGDTSLSQSPQYKKEPEDFWGILHLESGDLNMLVDGIVHHLDPGQMLLYPPHTLRSISSSQDAVIDVVTFTASSEFLLTLTDRVLQLDSRQDEALRQIILLGNTLFSKAPAERYDRGMVPRKDTTGFQLKKLSNLLELFFIDLYETGSTLQPATKPSAINTKNYQSEQFARLTNYLNTHIGESLILEQISAGCAISIPNLHKLCKKQCGCGPITYFISLKIGAAKRLMRESSLNFTQIANHLGFSSVHYFSKLFKAKTGMSPSEYARSVYRK